MLPLDKLKLGAWFFTFQIVATTSVDDDLDGAPIDVVLGVEDVAPFFFVLVVLERQDLGDHERGT